MYGGAERSYLTSFARLAGRVAQKLEWPSPNVIGISSPHLTKLTVRKASRATRRTGWPTSYWHPE